MIHRVLAIGRWVVDFLFAVRKYDKDGVLSCLYDSYAPPRVMHQAVDLMNSCEYDCGFTYSNPEKRRAVVLIGPASSGKEWQNTLAHEVYHLVVNISDNEGLDLFGESPAYLTGDVIGEFFNVICKLGCERCNDALNER